MLAKLRFKTLHWFLKFLILALILVLALLFIVYALPKILPTAQVSNTTKYGIIFQNEHWSGEVKIIGDIWALPGTQVTIDPGTKVLVRPQGDQLNLHLQPWGLRSGLNTGEDWYGVRNGELFWDESNKIQIRLAKIFAVGTKQQPILIKSDRNLPGSPYDFNIFSVTSGVISNAKFSNYRKFLVGDDVSIIDSEFSQTGECAICAEYTSPTISGNTFNGSLRQDILVIGGSPRISDNNFVSKISDAIIIDPHYWGSPIIYRNDFNLNNKIAVDLLSGNEENGGAISLNNFSGESIIQIPCDTKVKILQNQIRGPIRLVGGDCRGSLTLGPNYWDTQDPASVLSEKILGKPQDFIVSIPTLLKFPPKSGRSSQS